MSIIESYQNSIKRRRETITRLLNEKARESTKIANASKKIDSARSAISRTKNQTTIKNRLRDIERAEKDKSESYKKIASIDGKISKLEKEIANDEKRLNQEQMREQKRQLKKDADLQRKTQRQIDSVNRTLQLHENVQSNMQDQIEALKRLPEKITVLFLAANPKNTNSLRLDEEAREIQERIRKSEYRDTITFESRWAVRTGDIIEVINEVKPDIIHFSGHGNEYGDLVFENEYGASKTVTIEGYDISLIDNFGYRIVNTDITVRLKPDCSSRVIGHLKRGAVVLAIRKYKKWVEITWTDVEGNSYTGFIQNYKLTRLGKRK